MPNTPNPTLNDLESLEKKIENLPNEAKRQFYKLRNIYPHYYGSTTKLGIFFTNCYKINDTHWIGLYLNMCLINHSCAPNAMIDTTHLQDKEPCCQIRAIKDISKGEEVTVFYFKHQEDRSYKELGVNAVQRKKAIRNFFQFECICCVCSGNVPDQGDIIKELLKLHKLLFRNKSGKNPSASLHVKILEKIVDLNMKLYIGCIYDKVWSLQELFGAACKAQEKDLKRKAFDTLKKLGEDMNLSRVLEHCEQMRPCLTDTET